MAAQAGPVDAQSLRQLLAKMGNQADRRLVELRLIHSEKAQLLNHYIGPASGRSTKGKADQPWLHKDGRCYPSMLPTQASGRWSITEPPLTTFPPAYRSIVVPDWGFCWVTWDWDAIEARIVACEVDDLEDIQAFRDRLDIHTLSACRIFRLPLPMDLQDPHNGVLATGWRIVHNWGGKDDRRRHLAKTARYALFYSLDERGILEVKDVEKLGETQQTLLDVGRQWLQSKPGFVSKRRYYWEDAKRTFKATTFLNRPRKLWGDPKQVMKEGWNHRIQGGAAGMMNRTLLAIFRAYPQVRLAWQSHDSGTLIFPADDRSWWPGLKGLVERTWIINGHEMPFTASWSVTEPGGHICRERCTPHRHASISPDEWMQRAA